MTLYRRMVVNISHTLFFFKLCFVKAKLDRVSAIKTNAFILYCSQLVLTLQLH